MLFRSNRHTDKLYIDWNWDYDVMVDEYIIIEGWIIVDPDTYNKVYDDRMLKKLATAYIKRQWGNNMKKFDRMQLPGGVTMKGQEIFDEAVNEIAATEKEIRETYEQPPIFLVG